MDEQSQYHKVNIDVPATQRPALKWLNHPLKCISGISDGEYEEKIMIP